MATDKGYEILVGSSISADKHASILATVLRVIPPKTRTVTFNTTYAAGTTSVNQATIAIGTTVDLAIRVTMDSAVVGTEYVANVLSNLIKALKAEGITLTYGSTYTAGDRTYNLNIVVS